MFSNRCFGREREGDSPVELGDPHGVHFLVLTDIAIFYRLYRYVGILSLL